MNRHLKILIPFLIATLVMCNINTEKEEITNPRGKTLSETYCTSCHAYSSPKMLDRSSWGKVLSLMKHEMDKASIQINEQDWLDIQQYYLLNSSLSLPQPFDKKEITEQSLFIDSDLPDSIPGAIPVVTLVEFDSTSDFLYTGDISGNLFQIDQFHFRQIQIDNVPIDIEINEKTESIELLGIGSLMPSEEMSGQLINIGPNGKQSILVDSLKRPVDFCRKDFNNDGNEEYLISSFGSTKGELNSGKLSLYVPKNEDFQEIPIKQLPGARKSAIVDFNKDGLLDIISLFAQGREAIFLFINRGNFEFEEKLLLEFEPIYGSNDIELVDMNNDSFLDIVFTNGDNGDNTPLFKYYHGLRIFINDGNYNFSQEYFYPLNGASQVILRDFDLDGDPDLVVLSMYPDLFSWTNEMLVYFENRGNMHFQPYYLETEPIGKWILMEAADVDDDGDQDLIVGTNHLIQGVLIPPEFKNKWNEKQIIMKTFINPTN